jgi:galactokinase
MKLPNPSSAAPRSFASAPGRVNLLGEHTDYNDGFMLPVATPQRTEVALAAARTTSTTCIPARWTATSPSPRRAAARRRASAAISKAASGWSRPRGVAVPPLRVFVTDAAGRLRPVVLGRARGGDAARAAPAARLRARRRQLAQIAQRAEIDYARVNCGIMDQMASSLCDEQNMLFIDARTLEHRLVPMPADTELIVIDSGVPRTLAASKYNERRAECEEAARKLGVKALRDVHDPAAVESLPEPLRRRARHVVLENLRVLEAAQGVSAERFGELMNASHDSLRDDYEVSIPELDQLVRALRGAPGVFGARLTGAGFGGACVALCRAGQARQAAASRTLHLQQSRTPRDAS